MFCATTSQSLLVVLTPALGFVAADLHVAPESVGQARTVTAVAALLATAAALRSRALRGPRPLAFTGVLIGAAGAVTAAITVTLWQFLAAHVLVGIGSALLLSAAFTGAATFPAGRRRGVTGWVAAGNALAWLVVAPLAGIVTDAASWRETFLLPLGGVLAVIALLPAATAGQAPFERRRERSRAVWRDRAVRTWLLAETMAYAGWSAVLTYVGIYFVFGTHLPVATVGWVLAGGAGCYFLTATRSGELLRRLPLRAVVAVAAAVMATGAAVLFSIPAPSPVAVTAFGVLGAAAGLRTPGAAALAQELAEVPAHTMMTIRTGVTQLGYLLGASLGGAALAVWGYPGLGLLLAAGLATSALLVRRLSDRRGGDARRRGGASDAAADAQLQVGVRQVPLHGARAEVEPATDLVVGQPRGDQ